MKIDAKVALQVLCEEERYPVLTNVSSAWVEKIEHLSALCEQLGVMTHIAFLGTAVLAKSVDAQVDLIACKPRYAAGNPNAFSARTLCHNVLVPFSADKGVSLGVNGREPLNNQPYFRMQYLGDGTPVRAKLRPAFDYTLELVRELSGVRSTTEAREALRAFIFVRKRYQKAYVVNESPAHVSPQALLLGIVQFVHEDSEGGRRAQAVVAGLMDVYAGPERVESGRINDPSRHYPGDVSVRSENCTEGWEKAIEVRDKPVSVSDAKIFTRQCYSKGVREAAVVMVSERQPELDLPDLQAWADKFGMGVNLFKGWPVFVEQVLFWCPFPRHEAANLAAAYIEARLIAVDASNSSIDRWWDCLNESRSHLNIY